MGKNANMHRSRRNRASDYGKVFYRQRLDDDDNQDAFDTLIEKICEPAPWDYSVND